MVCPSLLLSIKTSLTDFRPQVSLSFLALISFSKFSYQVYIFSIQYMYKECPKYKAVRKTHEKTSSYYKHSLLRPESRPSYWIAFQTSELWSHTFLTCKLSCPFLGDFQIKTAAWWTGPSFRSSASLYLLSPVPLVPRNHPFLKLNFIAYCLINKKHKACLTQVSLQSTSTFTPWGQEPYLCGNILNTKFSVWQMSGLP